MLCSLSKTSPRKFWKYISKCKIKQASKTNVHFEDCIDHFQEISNTHELDCPFNITEIKKTTSYHTGIKVLIIIIMLQIYL